MKNLQKIAFGWIILLIFTLSLASAYDYTAFAANTISIISGENSADFFGSSVSCAGDVDKDGYEDLIIGAYGKDGYTGTVYVIYGGAGLGKSDIDFSTPLNPPITGFTIKGFDSSGRLGLAVSSGDVDKDGYDDIIIGAPLAGSSSQGVVYVVYGCSRVSRENIDLSTPLTPTSNGFSLTGAVGNGQFGISLSAGDINYDGYADIIIGACGENSQQGAAYIVYGGLRASFVGLTLSTLNSASTGFKITGKATGTYFGWSVSLGDINKDNYADIVVGAKGGSVKGVVYGIYGGPKTSLPNLDLSSTTLTATSTPSGFAITGAGSSDLTGSSVSIGTINNDVYGDIVIGAPQTSSNIGSVYIFYGGSSKLSNFDLSGVLTAGFTLTGKAGDYFGTSVSAAGDLNGDGYQDIVIGAPGSGSSPGGVYVKFGGGTLYGESMGSRMTGNVDAKTIGWAVSGVSSGGLFGFSVSNAGDVNNDGYDDIIIGAYGASKAYLLIYNRCPSSPACTTCYFPSNCNTCMVPRLIMPIECLCPVGQYDTGTICSSCSGCLTCSTSATTCTSCASGQYANNGACVSSCADATYANGAVCSACPTNCKTCTDSNTCTVCTPPYFLYLGHCFDSCPVKTVQMSTTTCAASTCPSNCIVCATSSVCTTCSSTYYLYQDQCYKPCPPTTFANTTTTCESCLTNCNTCSSPSDCTACTSPYRLYQDKCYDPCPAKTYADSSTTCAACTPNCDVCDSTGCTVCSLGYSPSASGCCPVTQYYNGATCSGIYQCRISCNYFSGCPAHCDYCSDSNTCTRCSSTYYLYQSQSQCVDVCPLATYYTTSNEGGVSIDICEDCSSHCESCSDSSTCLTCSMKYYVLTNNDGSKSCDGCPDDCDYCSDSATCTACTTLFFLYQGQCQSYCPSNTYTTFDPIFSSYACEDCPNGCNGCTGSSACQACLIGYYLYTDPSGLTTICQACSTNCDVCVDSNICTTCSSTYYLHQNGCVQNCPVTTYAITSPIAKCGGCPSNCDICTDSNTCTSCTSPNVLYQGQCFPSCPVKSYPNSATTCGSCPTDCDQCSDHLTCTQCSTSSVIYESQCYSSCPVTTFKVGRSSVCQKCSSNCDTCTSATSCTACSNGFYLWEARCYNFCPTGSFLPDSTYSSCGACPSNCDQCSSGSVCSSCSANYFLYEEKCFSSCPTQTFQDSSNTCSDCEENCAKCFDSTRCQTCIAGYLLSGLDCVDHCPLEFYPSSGVCHACPVECSECTGWTNCQACSPGFVRFKSQCLEECPAKTFESNLICLDCSEGCLKCASGKECQVCEDGYILSDSNACVQNIEESAKDKAGPALFESTSLIGASMTAGSSLPLNFGLVAKILRNIKYMDLAVSPELQKTFYSWKVASGFMSAPDSLRQESPAKGMPYVFGRYALDPVFLVNFWKPFFMTIIGLGLFAIFKALEVKFEKEKEKKIYSISRQINVAASNFALTQFYSNLDDVILYFGIQLRSTSYDSAFGALSCGIAIVLAMIGVIVLSFHSSLLGKYQSMKGVKGEKSQSLETFTQKYENYKLIYNDFKDTNYLTQSFLFFNLLRSLISSLIIATLYQSPGLQIALLMILNLCMLAFLSLRKPFKELVDNCGQIFCELVLLIANISVTILILCDQGDSSHYSAVERLSQCIIVLNFILLFGCAILLLINVGKMLYKSYKEKKHAKKPLEKSQASTDLKDLFNSSKFSRPNQSFVENKTDQSLMPIVTNDISGELFNNNASRMYQNNNKSPDLSFTQNISGLESPEMLFKQEPMMISDSYIVENPLDFESEMEKKSSIKESTVINPVNMAQQIEEDVLEIDKGKLAHKNSLSTMEQSIRRRGGKVRILRNDPQYNLKKMNGSTVEMGVMNLDDAIEN